MAEDEPDLRVRCPPWLQADWVRLHRRHAEGRMPHATLIGGKPGIGKRRFAHFVAHSLLCRQPTDASGACGHCASCQQLQAGAHADFRFLEPEGAGQTIKIDSVRELNDWLQLTADRGSYKLALIDTADAMTINAANSLLKTLEEPGAAALIVLVSDMPARLPATVLSRCQLLTLRLQDQGAALAWLEGKVADPQAALLRAHGAPLRALQEANADWQEAEAALRKAWQDLFLHRASIDRIVKSLDRLPPARTLQRFSAWTAAAARRRLSSSSPADEAEQALVASVQQCMNTDDWFVLHERIGTLYRMDSASFKAQAVLEGLFAQVRRQCSDIGRAAGEGG